MSFFNRKVKVNNDNTQLNKLKNEIFAKSKVFEEKKEKKNFNTQRFK